MHWRIGQIPGEVSNETLLRISGKNVVGAKLKWDEKGICATRLFAPSAPWGNFDLVATEEIVTNWDENTPTGAGEIEVGEDVRAWVEGTHPNRGFLFIGDHHSFPHNCIELHCN